MKTHLVVIGYLCIGILSAFDSSERLLPRWLELLLWIVLTAAFTRIAFQNEIESPKQRTFHNSPRNTVAQTKQILGTAEISRGRCRESFESVTGWKAEHPNASWDHPTAAQIFAEFSGILNKHLRDFPDERHAAEVQKWIHFADEVQRNQN